MMFPQLSSRVAAVTLVLACLVSCLTTAAPAVEPGTLVETERTPLATVSKGILTESVVTSRDARHVAFARKVAEGVMVEHDGTVAGPYETIGPLSFSPDSQHLAYAAKRPEGDCVVVDGQAGAPYSDPTSLVWSPQSDRVAFVAFDAKGCCLVVQDKQSSKPQAHYSGIVQGSIRFSPDGQRLAYVAIRNGKQLVVVGEAAGPEYGAVIEGALVFSPDSRHVAYIAKREETSHRGILVVDGKERTEEEVSAPLVAFSPDSQRWCYGATRDGKHLTVVQDAETSTTGKPYEATTAPAFLPDGRQVIYGASDGDRTFVVVGDEEGTRYTGHVGFFLASPDGKHLAYVVSKRNGFRVVLDGREGAEYSTVVGKSLIFSADGQRLAYLTVSGKKEQEMKGTIVECSQGESRERGPYASVSPPVFGPQEHRLAFSFCRDAQQWGVTLDDAIWQGPAILLGDLVFDGPRAVRTVALIDEQLVSLQLSLSDGAQPVTKAAEPASPPQAKEPRAEGNLAATVEKLDKLLEANPENPTLLAARASGNLILGKVKLAHEDWSKAIALSPKDTGLVLNRVVASIALGDSEAVLRDLDAQVESAPDDLEVLGLRGAVLFALERREEGARDLRRALKQSVPAEQQRQAVADHLKRAMWLAVLARAQVREYDRAGRPEIALHDTWLLWHASHYLSRHALELATTAFPNAKDRLDATAPNVKIILKAVNEVAFAPASARPREEAGASLDASFTLPPGMGPSPVDIDRANLALLDQQLQLERRRASCLHRSLDLFLWLYEGAMPDCCGLLGKMLADLGEMYQDPAVVTYGQKIAASEPEYPADRSITLLIRQQFALGFVREAISQERRASFALFAAMGSSQSPESAALEEKLVDEEEVDDAMKEKRLEQLAEDVPAEAAFNSALTRLVKAQTQLVLAQDFARLLLPDDTTLPAMIAKHKRAMAEEKKARGLPE